MAASDWCVTVDHTCQHCVYGLRQRQHAGKSCWIAVIAHFARRIDGLNMVCKHPLGFIVQDASAILRRPLKKVQHFCPMTVDYLGCHFSFPILLAAQKCLLHHADLLVRVLIIGKNSEQPEPTSVNLFAACLYFLACRNARPAAAFSFPATTGSCTAHINNFLRILKKRTEF
jgi:hypothetical protein